MPGLGPVATDREIAAVGKSLRRDVDRGAGAIGATDGPFAHREGRSHRVGRVRNLIGQEVGHLLRQRIDVVVSGEPGGREVREEQAALRVRDPDRVGGLVHRGVEVGLACREPAGEPPQQQHEQQRGRQDEQRALDRSVERTLGRVGDEPGHEPVRRQDPQGREERVRQGHPRSTGERAAQQCRPA